MLEAGFKCMSEHQVYMNLAWKYKIYICIDFHVFRLEIKITFLKRVSHLIELRKCTRHKYKVLSLADIALNSS